MRDGGTAKGWMTLAGIVLVVVGLAGFVPNPLVGGANALLATDTAQHRASRNRTAGALHRLWPDR